MATTRVHRLWLWRKVLSTTDRLLYAMGQMGRNNADISSTVAWLRQGHSEFKPSRILDMGFCCGPRILFSGVTYPGAEVHGIDVAAPIIRYAHARSSAMSTVHFSNRTLSIRNLRMNLSIWLYRTSYSMKITQYQKSSRTLSSIETGRMDAGRFSPPYEWRLLINSSLTGTVPNNNEPFCHCARPTGLGMPVSPKTSNDRWPHFRRLHARDTCTISVPNECGSSTGAKSE